MSDPKTLSFYNTKAGDYAEAAASYAIPGKLPKLMSLTPPGGDLLDLGCGSGWAANEMIKAGFNVTAMDGSPGLAAEAKARYGIDVIVQQFTDMDWQNAFDGIWAWFCLQHAPRDAMDANLERVARALRPGGHFMMGLQEGDRDIRDTLDRHYSYYTAEDITARLARVGLTVTDVKRWDGEHFDGTPSVEMSLHAHA